MKDRTINIHITNKLSSELILGTDFLRENGAMINVRDNSVTFLPEGMASIAHCDKPSVGVDMVGMVWLLGSLVPSSGPR
jgi:hypothetical protein